ncbi:7678_t:CDS:2 [Funneliformis caledonium]|uniref:7678_t:CDS:1 n=1 Tax=Funneliformis caledonium TaxID=1117310 RepID=A0A9N9CJZ9_9GLOM|nr:7678_t:CDS:2 [Funneliformis caledonium]
MLGNITGKQTYIVSTVFIPDDIEKMFEDKLAKQQADHKVEMEKLKSKL